MKTDTLRWLVGQMVDKKTGMGTDASPPPADSQQHRMSNGGTFVCFVLHFQNGSRKKRLIFKLIFSASKIVPESH